MDNLTLQYYANNAQAVADRYESIVNNMSEHFSTAFPSNAKILDIGCGSGRDLALLHALDHDVYGVDATAEFVDLAQKLHPELKDRIVKGALPKLDIPFGGRFDGVLCSAVLMHIGVSALVPSALTIKQCLKKHGRLLYSVPSRRGDVIDDNQRDANGRLFIPDQAGRLQAIFEQLGFNLVAKWGNKDSLGRDEVEWTSVLMELSQV